MIKKFSLPDYYVKGPYLVAIALYKEQHPEEFFPDRIIDNCYGAHPMLLWTGGRLIALRGEPERPMEAILENFNQCEGVKLRHICTNSLITEELCLDYKSNYLLQYYMRPGDSITVASPILIEYLKKNYPQIPLIYSTTLNIKNIDEVNRITENNVYVMNYNFNNDDNYIKQLKHPENIEVLCAEPCVPNCPNRTKHYTSISRTALGLDTEPFVCPFKSETRLFDDLMELPHAITNERVDELSEMGIQYFKISGRAYTLPLWLYCIFYYLVRPEYLRRVYMHFLCTWWK